MWMHVLVAIVVNALISNGSGLCRHIGANRLRAAVPGSGMTANLTSSIEAWMTIANGLRRVCALGLVSFAGFLAACGTFEEQPVPACPRAFLPNDTARLVQFNGQGKDLTDVILEAEFAGYLGDCGYDLEEKVLNVVISPVINAELGPAAQGRNAKLQYFVALKDPSGEFIQKNLFDVDMVFPSNLNLARYRDEQVTLNVPLDDVWAGPDYEIYLGFQLSADQLDYNRRFGKN
jgi:hypothetical protein